MPQISSLKSTSVPHPPTRPSQFNFRYATWQVRLSEPPNIPMSPTTNIRFNEHRLSLPPLLNFHVPPLFNSKSIELLTRSGEVVYYIQQWCHYFESERAKDKFASEARKNVLTTTMLLCGHLYLCGPLHFHRPLYLHGALLLPPWYGSSGWSAVAVIIHQVLTTNHDRMK